MKREKKIKIVEKIIWESVLFKLIPSTAISDNNRYESWDMLVSDLAEAIVDAVEEDAWINGRNWRLGLCSGSNG